MPITTVTSECSRALQEIADNVARSKKIVVVTGAGISTNCGIPDFRSTDGLYNLVKSQYPNAVVKGRDLFDAVLWNDPISTSLFYTFLANLRREVIAVPDTTAVHKFIRTLAETGRLLRCYTQNIDGLEEREGLVMNLSHGKGKRKRPSPITTDDTRTDQEKGCQVVQLHGDLRSLRCTNCQLLTEYTASSVDLLMKGEAPVCEACEAASMGRQAAGKRATKVGFLRPNIVLYGEEHPAADQVGAIAEADIKAAPDMMIILGTSLKVHGLKIIVRQFAKAVHAKGGKVIFVNNTPPSDSVWEGVIDEYVEMDCDKWVADVRNRRQGIWEKQTKLSVKVSKSGAKGLTEKSIDLGDKENDGAPVRKRIKIPEPKTPSKGLVEKTRGLSLSVNQTPPSTVRRRLEMGKKNFLDTPSRRGSDSESDGNRSPMPKRRKLALGTDSPMISPPATPSRGRARMLRIEIPVNTPEKQLRAEIRIYEDTDAYPKTPSAVLKALNTVAKTPSRASPSKTSPSKASPHISPSKAAQVQATPSKRGPGRPPKAAATPAKSTPFKAALLDASFTFTASAVKASPVKASPAKASPAKVSKASTPVPATPSRRGRSAGSPAPLEIVVSTPKVASPTKVSSPVKMAAAIVAEPMIARRKSLRILKSVA